MGWRRQGEKKRRKLGLNQFGMGRTGKNWPCNHFGRYKRDARVDFSF